MTTESRLDAQQVRAWWGVTKAHRLRPNPRHPSSPGRPPPPALSAPPLPAPAAISAPSGPARGSRLLPSAPAPVSLPFRCRGGGSRAPADRAAAAAGGGCRGGGGVVRRRRCGGRAEPVRSWRWGTGRAGRQACGAARSWTASRARPRAPP